VPRGDRTGEAHGEVAREGRRLDNPHRAHVLRRHALRRHAGQRQHPIAHRNRRWRLAVAVAVAVSFAAARMAIATNGVDSAAEGRRHFFRIRLRSWLLWLLLLLLRRLRWLRRRLLRWSRTQ